ncbi:MAG: type II toxin-antitoxin system RelE/ParE family toxin [Planctomycetota bacterium]
MTKVLWTAQADDDLASIYQYISRDSEHYAKRMIERILRREAQIAEYPLSGRVVPEVGDSQIREIIEGNYRIIYKIFPNEFHVLTVVHGAIDLQKRSL